MVIKYKMCVCVDQEKMARAQMVILHGHQLAAGHHYALALVVQRCNELRHHCDIITNAMRAKRASLIRARDLLLRLEEVEVLTQAEHTLTHTHRQTLSLVCIMRCFPPFLYKSSLTPACLFKEKISLTRAGARSPKLQHISLFPIVDLYLSRTGIM